MRTLFFALIFSFALTVIFGLWYLPFLRRKKIGQPIYKYVETHKKKDGTPTTGGLFFIIPSVITFFIFDNNLSKISTIAVTIGIAFMFVGFLDDFIKIKSGENEGLKPYQKIIFQTGIALVAGFVAYQNGLMFFNLPFVSSSVNLGIAVIFIDAFIFIATTNCVNLTDGLDGLASSVSFIYFLALSTLIAVKSDNGIDDDLVMLCVSLLGGLLGFLVFNTSKASVFMGDTGSLSLGGFISAISIFSGNGFYIPIIGLVFVFTGVSVIIQVVYFKMTKKRIFLMAPFHHHLQLKGYSETKIVYFYSLITVLTGAISLIF